MGTEAGAPANIRWQNAYAVLSLTTFVSILVLITVGSIVRVTGNGLGCPDWPLCYGQVVPPMRLSAWVEFSHRLVGALTSAQIVALAVLAWVAHRRDPGIVWPATALLPLLALQVSLGAIHVLLELPPSSGWMHTGVAMAIAGVAVTQVGAAYPAARALSARAGALLARDRRLPLLLAVSAALTYLLILTGSYVTRSGASLACPSFPACGAGPAAAVYPQLVQAQMLHRLLAFAVAFLAGFALWRLARAAQNESGFRNSAWLLGAIILAQIALGVANVLLRLPPWSRTLHLLTAGLLWTGLVLLWTIFQRRPAAPAA
jgi:heme A synthase